MNAKRQPDRPDPYKLKLLNENRKSEHAKLNARNSKMLPFAKSV